MSLQYMNEIESKEKTQFESVRVFLLPSILKSQVEQKLLKGRKCANTPVIVKQHDLPEVK